MRERPHRTLMLEFVVVCFWHSLFDSTHTMLALLAVCTRSKRLPVCPLALQDRVYGAVVSKRRGLALSLIANAVLLALLVFKSTPPPPLRRCNFSPLTCASGRSKASP